MAKCIQRGFLSDRRYSLRRLIDHTLKCYPDYYNINDQPLSFVTHNQINHTPPADVHYVVGSIIGNSKAIGNSTSTNYSIFATYGDSISIAWSSSDNHSDGLISGNSFALGKTSVVKYSVGSILGSSIVTGNGSAIIFSTGSVLGNASALSIGYPNTSTQANVSYVGSFTFPNQSNINYAYGDCAYDTSIQKLYVAGAYNQPYVGVFSKPQINTQVTNSSWFDPTFGNWTTIATSGSGQGARHRGFYAENGGLWMMTTPFYDVSGSSSYIGTMGYTNGTSFNGWAKASIHELQTTGRIFNIPTSLRSSFGGYDTGCFNQDQQGGSLTNWGPALYLYNRQTGYVQDQNVSMLKVFDCVGQNSPNKYPNWWPDRRLVSAVMTNNYLVISYSKSVGARWYGNYGQGTTGYGRTWNEDATVPEHYIDSILYPGTTATDGTSTQGYHAESLRSFLLIAPIAGVIAGNPVWQEVDLYPLGVNYTSGELRITYDPDSDLIYGVERNGGSNHIIPKGHILQIT